MPDWMREAMDEGQLFNRMVEVGKERDRLEEERDRYRKAFYVRGVEIENLNCDIDLRSDEMRKQMERCKHDLLFCSECNTAGHNR